MLKLRLSMGGTKKRPVYKIVVADSKFPRDGRFIEKLGFFNPLLPKEKKERIGLQSDRIKYWLSQGAKPTMRVARLLGENQLMEMPAKGNNPLKAVPKKDRKKDTEEKTSKEGEKKAETPKQEEKKADAPKEEPKQEEPKDLTAFLNWVELSADSFKKLYWNNRDRRIWNKNKNDEWELKDSITNYISNDLTRKVSLEKTEECEFILTDNAEPNIDEKKYLLMGRNYINKNNYGAVQNKVDGSSMTKRKWKERKI